MDNDTQNCGTCARLLRCHSLNATLNLDGLCSSYLREPSEDLQAANQLAQVLCAVLELRAFDESSKYRESVFAPVVYAAAGRALRRVGIDPVELVLAAQHQKPVSDISEPHQPTRHCDCANCRAAISENIDGTPREDDGNRFELEAAGPGVRYMAIEELRRAVDELSPIAPRNAVAAERLGYVEAFLPNQKESRRPA